MTIEEAIAQIPEEWRGRGKIEWPWPGGVWWRDVDNRPSEVRAEFRDSVSHNIVGYGATITDAVLEAARRARCSAEDPDWGP